MEVARQAGHAPSMSLDTYQHVMDELEGVERVPAEEQIRRARAALYPFRTRGPLRARGPPAEIALTKGSRRADSNRGPLHYE